MFHFVNESVENFYNIKHQQKNKIYLISNIKYGKLALLSLLSFLYLTVRYKKKYKLIANNIDYLCVTSSCKERYINHIPMYRKIHSLFPFTFKDFPPFRFVQR